MTGNFGQGPILCARMSCCIWRTQVYKGSSLCGPLEQSPWRQGGNLMKHLLLVSGTVALMLAFVPGGSAQDLDGASSGKSVLYVAAQNAKFDQSPMPGVSMAIIWGDPALGAHATFTKFAP